MKAFEDVVSLLGPRFLSLCGGVPKEVKGIATEISLRTGRSMCIDAGKRRYFITSGGGCCEKSGSDIFAPSSAEMEDAFLRICNFSVYSKQNQLVNGFITLRGGHRAGIAGTAVLTDGKVTAFNKISSIRIRLAVSRVGAANCFFPYLVAPDGHIRSTVFAGPPGCGKTTVIRDLADALGSGRFLRRVNVAVADERCEIAACCDGEPGLLKGECCDVISCMPKNVAVLCAVRTLRPDVIVCDELGTLSEAQAFCEAVNCGCAVIATIHAGSFNEALQKPQLRLLCDYGVFENLIYVEGYDASGYIFKTGGLREFQKCAL